MRLAAGDDVADAKNDDQTTRDQRANQSTPFADQSGDGHTAEVEQRRGPLRGQRDDHDIGAVRRHASVPSGLFGLAIVTVDGQIHEHGDARHEFAIESISKVLTLAAAIEEVGPEQLHAKVGAEPTGMPFNSVMALELHDDRPLSPLVNAGAMATASLLTASHISKPDAESPRYADLANTLGDPPALPARQ
jgi:hypothetical protein